MSEPAQLHGTTILCVRSGSQVALGGDGQVSLGQTIVKGNAVKVRRLYQEKVLAGFAGGTADAFTLFERFEGMLEKYQGNLTRAAVELAKAWRSDRALRRLEAMLVVADASTSLLISGTAPYWRSILVLAVNVIRLTTGFFSAAKSGFSG